MNGAKTKFYGLISRFKTEIQQDKKRTTMLVVLLVVAGIIIGRVVVGYGPPDKTGGADSTASPRDRGSNDDGQNTGENTKTALTPKSTRNSCRVANRRIDTASMDRNITRDLFWPDTRCFPPSEQTDTNNGASQPEKPDHAQKLAEAEQREQLKRAEHIKSIRAKANQLCLTTTMLGRSPTALINGQVLRTGDLINGFRLKSISSNCCVVVMEDVEVKLKMPE